MTYVTRGLLEVLLEMAADAEPESVTAGLATTPATEFETDLGLARETPVFTHLYLPDAGASVRDVFGVDLATPPGRTAGLFVSHPQGGLEVTREDDLREVVVVAVPPWGFDAVAAFNRDGTGRELTVLDAEPPAEEFDAEEAG